MESWYNTVNVYMSPNAINANAMLHALQVTTQLNIFLKANYPELVNPIFSAPQGTSLSVPMNVTIDVLADAYVIVRAWPGFLLMVFDL